MAGDLLGPCCICGAINYALSCGGPTICPSCDCGNFGAHVVQRQGKEIIELRARLSTREVETRADEREACLDLARRVYEIQKDDPIDQFVHEMSAGDIINAIEARSLAAAKGEG